ncbi:hypothetical protein JCM21900_006410 [Sporobolomyces salmonicolor]
MPDGSPPASTSLTEPASSSQPITLPSLLPSPLSPPPKRADVVSLKLRLAALLPTHAGQAYWSAFTDFVLGRINRIELGEVLARCFKGESKADAVKLHNALLLSILYNTTRPYLPPSSIRHTGFLPRGKKRALHGFTGSLTAAQEQKRRKLKESVMSLGRRERGEIKLLGSAAQGEAGIAKKGKGVEQEEEERRERARRLGRGEGLAGAMGASRAGGAEVETDGVPKGLREREREGVALPPTLPQDYLRLVQTPLCCESRMLPDAATLQDRMLLLAYEEGMVEGVEARTAGLVSGAIDHYLKNMISSVISLVRDPSNLPSAVPPPRTSPLSAAPSPSTFAPAGAPPVPPAAPSPPAADAEEDEPFLRQPLTIADFHALFAISPGLLGPGGSTHSGAVERMYAVPPMDDSSDEEPGEGGEEPLEDPPANAATAQDEAGDIKTTDTAPTKPQTAGKGPRLTATASRARTSSFYGSARPLPPPPAPSSTTAERVKFILDPSSLHGVPEGHPDVPHLLSTPSALQPPLSADPANSAGAGAHAPHPSGLGAAPPVGAGGAAAGGLSPKSLSLRNSLFPELAASASSTLAGRLGTAAAAASGEAGNGTTTDDGGDSDDHAHTSGAPTPANGAGAGGLKIKLGGAMTGTAGGGGAAALAKGAATGGGAGGKPNDKDKEAGRKLWDVVDSVKLLNGVLPP